MALNTVKPDMVRYEMRMVQGVDPNVREQRKPGFFGRLLSGVGKVLGSVAMPLSFVFPPAALGAAGMYGVGAIGDQMQVRAQTKMIEKQQREQATNVVFPGMEMGGGRGPQPAAFDISARDQQVMNVLDARGGSMTDMAHNL